MLLSIRENISLHPMPKELERRTTSPSPQESFGLTPDKIHRLIKETFSDEVMLIKCQLLTDWDADNVDYCENIHHLLIDS